MVGWKFLYLGLHGRLFDINADVPSDKLADQVSSKVELFSCLIVTIFSIQFEQARSFYRSSSWVFCKSTFIVLWFRYSFDDVLMIIVTQVTIWSLGFQYFTSVLVFLFKQVGSQFLSLHFDSYSPVQFLFHVLVFLH